MKAFPNLQLFVSEMGKVRSINEVDGMDLRDYFAGKALSVLYKQFSEFEDGFNCSEVADASYQMADAMMKAREE
jgi:hypothetical protein